ncbi:MAG: S46 family peptidase [Bacteroidales bacterium]
MKKISFLLILTLFFSFSRADEGMWLPLFLKYNEAEMQQMGFKLTAEDVYSVNHHSMKDAIVLFGGGCTAELISNQGLLLTNHHCGYSYIQRYSTLEHNYLHDGFWAKSFQEEIPCEGLSVTFLVRMEDVTKQVLQGVTDRMNEVERNKMIADNIKKVKEMALQGTHYEAVVKSFYYGNQYFMFINEVYNDVRLVGTPPESIGKFGGDTDNWVWPRHTGDFSLYRIYADRNNNPADYSKDNVPYKPKKYFPISIKGVEENDFTLVFGYPGTTMQFLISDGIDLVVNARNPVAIHQRGVRLDIMKKYMDQSLPIRLMYSAKANSISNGWKKWIGENNGIKDCKVIEKKRAEEAGFMQWVVADETRKSLYGSILQDIKNDYKIYRNFDKSFNYVNETFNAIELFRFLYQNCYPVVALSLQKNSSDDDFNKAKAQLLNNIDGFYASFYKPIDKEVFVELLHYYFSTLEPELIPEALRQYLNIPQSQLSLMADEIYETSVFSDAASFKAFIEKANKKSMAKLSKNLAFQLMIPVYNSYQLNYENIITIKQKLNNHYRIYVEALMEKDKEKTFYPDANLTMRVTYGKVKGFEPTDGVEYVYYTTIDGIMEKENPDVFDYKVAPKLKSLYESKDYGRYANRNGELPVAFIASNHTTGGNSGSPVINANGELIGVNFDRVWEGTMSDLNYDVNRCRNISLDIRYFLFIVDKFAGAQNLLEEMEIK